MPTRERSRLSSGFTATIGIFLLVASVVYSPRLFANLIGVENGFRPFVERSLWVASVLLCVTGVGLMVFRARGLARNVALLFFGIGLSIGLAEVVVRVVEPEARFRVMHPEFHHAFAPNQTGAEMWGDRTVQYHTNSLGFRDRSVRNVEKEAADLRVLLLGDSFVEGMGVEYDSTVAGRLVRVI